MAKRSVGNRTSRRKEESAVMLVIIALVVAWALYSGYFNIGVSNVPAQKERTALKDSIPVKDLTLNDAEISEDEKSLTVNDVVKYLGYPQNRGWTGVIIAMNSETYSVRITAVNTGGPLIYHLYPNECTGNKKIGQESVDQVIDIPKSCLDNTK